MKMVELITGAGFIVDDRFGSVESTGRVYSDLPPSLKRSFDGLFRKYRGLIEQTQVTEWSSNFGVLPSVLPSEPLLFELSPEFLSPENFLEKAVTRWGDRSIDILYRQNRQTLEEEEEHVIVLSSQILANGKSLSIVLGYVPREKMNKLMIPVRESSEEIPGTLTSALVIAGAIDGAAFRFYQQGTPAETLQVLGEETWKSYGARLLGQNSAIPVMQGGVLDFSLLTRSQPSSGNGNGKFV
ncbi:hypothetical protein HYU95_03255 [Candidatus Daviesbacteria bacterium]|nr:hypothetical protein [Candidatus Daviesbacteria bacterium]